MQDYKLVSDAASSGRPFAKGDTGVRERVLVGGVGLGVGSRGGGGGARDGYQEPPELPPPPPPEKPPPPENPEPPELPGVLVKVPPAVVANESMSWAMPS